MPYIWLDARDATAVHDRSLVLHGGPGGVRDQGLLLSALARPQQLAVYGEGVDRIQLAAAYTAGVVQNYPFIDGNKRTGFILGVLFLELNGLNFIASEEDAADAVLSLAAGTLEEVGYVDFLRRNAR
ncbi:death-on-curing family protein (plasmid) [Asticcacaulis excentricus CB 48]|uniref:Death-on-curing family protein n=2 Tax=Asticcacaulis excentricus TaxID=78587 RepID=E8RVF4_ASTEC|nr:death-on-curing family protein [Asticcacaulis excentricus CB 48]